MEQVITRRFRHEIEGDGDFAHRPDLLLIDGGATHAAVASRVLAQYGLSIPVFGMVKDDRHRTWPWSPQRGEEIGIQGPPPSSPSSGRSRRRPTAPPWASTTSGTPKAAWVPPLEKIPSIGGDPAEKPAESLRQCQSHPAGRPICL